MLILGFISKILSPNKKTKCYFCLEVPHWEKLQSFRKCNALKNLRPSKKEFKLLKPKQLLPIQILQVLNKMYPQSTASCDPYTHTHFLKANLPLLTLTSFPQLCRALKHTHQQHQIPLFKLGLEILGQECDCDSL